MTHARLPFHALAALALGMAVGACARAPGIAFSSDAVERVWPQPPDRARIRFVGEVRSAESLNGEPSLDRVIFGKRPVAGLTQPLGVCTDGADRVFIADGGEPALHVFDLGRARHERWSVDPKIGRFIQPVAVAFVPPDRVAVSDAGAGRVFLFDDRGRSLGEIGADVLERPCGLAVRPGTRRLVVADPAAHQVVEMNLDGAEVARLGSRGDGPGRFNYPTQLAFDAEGRLYVADSLNFRVQVFGPHLEFIRHIGRKGDLPGYFAQPKGVALDRDGHLYVVDANFEAVQIFSGEGDLLLAFGREGRGAGEFWLPVGIHIDPSGRIWVADSYNRRVQVFQYLGEEAVP